MRFAVTELRTLNTEHRTPKTEYRLLNTEHLLPMYKSLILISFLILTRVSLSQTDSLLCQGDYWTEDEANVMMKKFAGEWNDIASWQRRASIIKQNIIRGMHLENMPEIQGNFNPIIRNTRKFDGYFVENIAIESFPGFYITGNLYRPIHENKRHAAIICTHGHWDQGRVMDDTQKLCAVFARMGAVVFALDMIGYGNSGQTSHNMPIALLLQTWNNKRVLEYLISRSDVDNTRIGITGASGGGTQTMMLTALDDRIKASAPVVMVSAHFFGGCECESGMPIHRSAIHQTNNVEIAALCAPRPMLVVSDGADWTRNTPLVEYPYIKRVYGLYNCEHKVENAHFPVEKHDYGYSKRKAVYFFFAHHLGLDINTVPYNNCISEEFVTVLPGDSLNVFTPVYPIPGDALKGDEAVMKYLGF